MIGELVNNRFLLIICLVETLVALGYIHVVVPDAIERNKKSILIQVVCGIAVVFLLFSNRQILFFSDFAWVIEIGIWGICVLVCAKKHRLLLFEIMALYCAIIALLDFFFAFLCMSILKDAFWSTVYFRTYTGWSSGIYLCTRLLCLIFLLWLQKKTCKGISISRFKKLLLPICGLLCILVRFFRILLVRIANGSYDLPGWSVGISLLIFLILLLLLTFMMHRTGVLQDENDILRIQDEMQQIRYEDLTKHEEENKRLLHDMKHHIMALQGYCENNDIQGVSDYLSEMGMIVRKSDQKKWTNNNVLDIVLCQKQKDAEDAGIQYEVDCSGYCEIPLEKEAIVSLFGNLLDNAIEACIRTEQEHPYIEINIRQQEQILYIDITNSNDEKLVIKNDLILSSKRNKQSYGYGLKNVKRIVEKYDGVLSIKTDAHKFCVYITFCL